MRIEVRDLVVDRGGFRAIDGVDLTVQGGEWLGIVGANGSGKTSLLRAVAGRIEARAGTIRIDGIDRTSERQWRAANIGFAPDPASLPASLSGHELFAILASQTPGTAASEPLSELRSALGLDRFLDRPIGALSAGMRQRLAIFCAFHLRPGAVILDEPFNWLDPVCAFDTKQALSCLVADGLTLVTALHEMTTLVRYCRSGLLLSEGKVRRRLDRAQLEAGARDYGAFEAEMVAGLRDG